MSTQENWHNSNLLEHIYESDSQKLETSLLIEYWQLLTRRLMFLNGLINAYGETWSRKDQREKERLLPKLSELETTLRSRGYYDVE